MKHLLNNLTESEKKEILSKYDGSLKVKIDKFTKLVESRLGDVRLHESSKRIMSESKDPEWYKKFPCLKNRKAFTLNDKSIGVYDDYKNIYYSDGVVIKNGENKRRYWFCSTDPEQSDVLFSVEDPKHSQRLDAISKGLAVPLAGENSGSGQQGERVKYRDCTSKKTFSLGCMDTRPKDKNEIMKLQGCLGVTPDGKFGLGTLNKFLQLSPESGGVAKIDTIQNICSNIKTAKNLGADDTVPGQ